MSLSNNHQQKDTYSTGQRKTWIQLVRLWRTSLDANTVNFKGEKKNYNSFVSFYSTSKSNRVKEKQFPMILLVQWTKIPSFWGGKKGISKGTRADGETKVFMIFMCRMIRISERTWQLMFAQQNTMCQRVIFQTQRDNSIINFIILSTIWFCLSTQLTAGVSFLIANIPNGDGKTQQLNSKSSHRQPHHAEGNDTRLLQSWTRMKWDTL